MCVYWVEGEVMVGWMKRLGMKPGEAVDLSLAEVGLREDLPFVVTADSECVLSVAEQGLAWEEVLGEY